MGFNQFDQVKNPNEKVQIFTKTDKWGSIILIKLKSEMEKVQFLQINKIKMGSMSLTKM